MMTPARLARPEHLRGPDLVIARDPLAGLDIGDPAPRGAEPGHRRVGQPGCFAQLPQRCRDGGALRVWQLSGEGTHPLLDLLVQKECTTAQLN